MIEVEVIGEVDSKGRVTIPKKIREKLDLEPKDKVKIKIIEVMPRKSFLKYKGLLKGSGDAVRILHEESPIRF